MSNDPTKIDMPVHTVSETPAPAVEEVKTKLEKNKNSREKAEEILELIDLEFKDGELNDRFWEVLRDKTIQKVGLPPKDEVKVTPMDTKEYHRFKKQTFIRGKYVDMAVGSVEKKDPDWLKNYATRLEKMQVQVQRYLAYKPPEKKPKPVPKPGVLKSATKKNVEKASENMKKEIIKAKQEKGLKHKAATLPMKDWIGKKPKGKKKK